MASTVRYFFGLAQGMGAFDYVSSYLAQTLRFADADLTSANTSTVVTIPEADRPALPREMVFFHLIGDAGGFLRPRDPSETPSAPAAAVVARGIPIDENSRFVEFQLPQGWTVDFVAAT